MKKKLISLSAAVILVLSLASCAGNDDAVSVQTTTSENASQSTQAVTEPEPETSAVETAKSEGFTSECKQAYLNIIKYYERMRGEYESERYFNDYEQEEFLSDGVMFCDLFDWDLNGTPELFVGYSSCEYLPYRVSAIEIYTYENDSVRLLLKEAPRHSYMFTSSEEAFWFSRSSDGSLVLRVDDTEQEWDTSDSNYYRYDGVSVSATKLSICGTKTEDNEFITCDYYINGIPCTQEEYNNCEESIRGKDVTRIDIRAYDYSDIVSYLSGKSDSCEHLLFKGYDGIAKWFSEYLAF